MAQEGGAAGGYLMSGGVPGLSDETTPPKPKPPKPPAVASWKTEDYMKKHPYSHTHIEHHKDGSHTVHHVHESGDSKKDIKSGVSDHDGLMDHMMDHTSGMNEGEGHDENNEALAPPVVPGLMQGK